MTIYYGLNIARKFGCNRIHCYSNSQTVLDPIYKYYSPFRYYVGLGILRHWTISKIIMEKGNMRIALILNNRNTCQLDHLDVMVNVLFQINVNN